MKGGARQYFLPAMPRTQELKALDEAIARHNARSGYNEAMPRKVVKKGYSKPPPPPQKVVKKMPITHVGECAPEHIRIVVEAEAKAAEKGRQAIARLLVELNKEA